MGEGRWGRLLPDNTHCFRTTDFLVSDYCLKYVMSVERMWRDGSGVGEGDGRTDPVLRTLGGLEGRVPAAARPRRRMSRVDLNVSLEWTGEGVQQGRLSRFKRLGGGMMRANSGRKPNSRLLYLCRALVLL